VVVERYGLMPDSGGAGRWRGGLALVRDFRFVGEEAILQVRADRQKYLPYGLAGGQPGTPSRNELDSRSEARVLPSKFTMNIGRDDLFRHVQPGGGGYGDPLEREPSAVLEDVLDEKLTQGYAELVYGVALDATGERVDHEATAALRARLRKTRNGT
jgi:N-methylhydantoinase B